MTPSPDATDDAVTRAFAGLPALLDEAPRLLARGRLLDCDCLIGPMARPFHAAIRSGRIVELAPSPVLMRSWRFSYRATPQAWAPIGRPSRSPAGTICWR
ncbi:hypothetical protein [Bradyrhizobium sp. BR 1433]|uniref:hypothetical protein n=1 Tax=Bradyrhizobium sp. BR 1433 TaxID=3447967 RepID=UPI003EE63AB6